MNVPTATTRLENPDAVLTRTDLAQLGYGRRAIDAIFKACGAVEKWEGGRPMIRVADFVRAREERTFRGDRVRPMR